MSKKVAKPAGTGPTGMEVAIIGMACRFPEARNYKEFWENLKNGRESIRFFSTEELEAAGVDPASIANANFVRSGGGILEDKEYFDSGFFDYSHREAELMDPQLRVFHECCWEALEDAGYNPYSYKGAIGLYGGASSSFYWQGMVELSGKHRELGRFAADQLANRDFLTARVSYKLNLKGANSTLNTACSTSLAAIHQACRALLTAECKIAMAGGVSVTASPQWGYMYQEGMILSPDGHTRAFDAGANGTNSGDGVGIVVLKLLKNALADNDHIHAVIKGSGANNDGSRKVGFTAPSVEGQSEAIRRALRMAKVEPRTITYIETHGTGTPLGDPVEIEALKRAFKAETMAEKNFCALGSVKTNIGHLDAAAGAASIIKTVLALQNKQIPASLNFQSPNPAIDFADSPFFVNTEPRDWRPGEWPRRAGVSSFGIGGTNVHVILEEWRQSHKQERGTRQPRLLLLSAKSEAALDRMSENLVKDLKEKTLNRDNPGENVVDPIDDIIYTLQVGRRSFKYRRKAICSSSAEAVEALSSPGSRKVRGAVCAVENPPLVFMFAGLGGQYTNMGRGLYEEEPVFREELDRCFQLLKPLLGMDVKEILYPPSAAGETNLSEIDQPVIFSFEYALAKLLMHHGIEPHAMIGYSFGEYAAACIAGVFSLEDALTLVVERCRLIARIPGGGMLSVPLERKELAPCLADAPNLSLAIDNGESCIVAGTREALAEFETRMKDKRVMCMPVPNAHAIHSHLMEPILQDFETIVSAISFNEPKIPYISNVSGDWITVEQAMDPGYWVTHLRAAVRFADGINVLLGEPHALFVEIGPGGDLTAMMRRRIDSDSSGGRQAINLVRHPQKQLDDVFYLLNQLGNLWLYGTTIDWASFYGEEIKQRQRVPLPTYPFERQRYWIEMPAQTGQVRQETQPAQVAETVDVGVDITALVEQVGGMEGQLETQLDIKGIAGYRGFEALTNRLCTSLICHYYFKANGVGIEKGRVYENKEALKQALHLLPKFNRFLDFFIGVLAEDKIVAVEDGRIRFLRDTPGVEDPQKLKAKARKKYPQFSGLFESIAYCASHYPAALSGQREAIGVLFPGGSYFREQRQYKNEVEYDNTIVYINLLNRFILDLLLPVWQRRGKNTLRILEVGAGTGSLTRRLTMALNEHRQDSGLDIAYHFTDLGNFFVVNARKEAAQSGRDFMSFGVLDISRDPVEQGCQPHSFDLVLGLNVVHATPSIARSLENCKTLLSAGGLLLLVEGTNPPRWMNMIDGLAEGWWYFEDEETRSDSPLLSPATWQEVVTAQGFRDVTIFPRQEEKRRETRCCMIVGRQEAGVQTAARLAAVVERPRPAATLYSRPELTSRYEPPRDELERGLAGILQDFFGIEQVGIDDDFFELGMDSLIATVLATRFQERFRVRLPLAEIYENASVRRLARHIQDLEGGVEAAADENLVLLRRGSDAGRHLFIVHAGSGEVGAYMELCQRMEPRFNCWGIRSDKPRGYAPRNVTIEEIARTYVQKIQTVQPDGPYFIAGWSAGGAIAFEMVRLLERREADIAFLGLISSTAPQEDWWFEAKKFDLDTERQWLKEHFPKWKVKKHTKGMTGIQQVWAWVVDHLEKNNIGVSALNPLVPEFMVNAIPGADRIGVKEWVTYLNVVRTYMNAHAFYIPENKIGARLHFFEATRSDVANRGKWNDYTAQSINEYKIIGTHNSIFEPPEVEEFAEAFNKVLTSIPNGS